MAQFTKLAFLHLPIFKKYYFKTKRLQMIKFIITIILSINFINAVGQSKTSWVTYLDTKRNGFLSRNPQEQDIFPLMNQEIFQYYLQMGFNLFNDFLSGTREPEVYIKSNNKMILIWNDTKKRITKNEYDEIQKIGFNTYKVRINGYGCGIIDTAENIIIPIKYLDIYSLDPYLYYKIEDGEIRQISNLEIQMFYGIEWTGLNKENLLKNPGFGKMISCDGSICRSAIILRNGNILKQLNTGHISASYFVNKGEVYNVFSFCENVKNIKPSGGGRYCKEKSLIGKLFSISDYVFFGSLSSEWEGNVRNKFFENPLLMPIMIRNHPPGYSYPDTLRVFNFDKIRFESTVPWSIGKSLEKITKFYAKTTRLDPSSSRRIIYNLISSEGKEIIPFSLNYTTIERLDNHVIYNSSRDNPSGLELYELAQNNIDNDSLILISRDIIKDGRNYTNYGLYKLFLGEILSPRYKKITRVTNNFCIVEEHDDNSQNVIDLRTCKKVFQNNYDWIYYDTSNNYFLCRLDGKDYEKIIQ
jgi:hypothetical protein